MDAALVDMEAGAGGLEGSDGGGGEDDSSADGSGAGGGGGSGAAGACAGAGAATGAPRLHSALGRADSDSDPQVWSTEEEGSDSAGGEGEDPLSGTDSSDDEEPGGGGRRGWGGRAPGRPARPHHPPLRLRGGGGHAEEGEGDDWGEGGEGGEGPPEPRARYPARSTRNVRPARFLDVDDDDVVGGNDGDEEKKGSDDEVDPVALRVLAAGAGPAARAGGRQVRTGSPPPEVFITEWYPRREAAHLAMYAPNLVPGVIQPEGRRHVTYLREGRPPWPEGCGCCG